MAYGSNWTQFFEIAMGVSCAHGTAVYSISENTYKFKKWSKNSFPDQFFFCISLPSLLDPFPQVIHAQTGI